MKHDRMHENVLHKAKEAVGRMMILKNRKAVFIRDSIMIIVFPVLMIISIILTILVLKGIIQNKNVLYFPFGLWLSLSIIVSIINLHISSNKEKDILKAQYFKKLMKSKKYNLFYIISSVLGVGFLTYAIFIFNS